MSDNAPAVIASVPTADIPSGGSPTPARGSEPASPSRPPGSKTSVEDLTVMSAIEGLGPEQMDEDDDPSIPEQQRKTSRAKRYRRGLEAAREKARTERIGRLQAERTLKERYGDEPRPPPESNLSGRVPERTAPDDEAQQQEPAQYDDEAQPAEQYEGEQQHEPASPEEQEAARQEFGQRAVKEIEARAAYSERERQFAQQLPNYRETLQSVSDVPIPEHTAELIRESPVGPIIAYALAASVDGLEQLHQLQQMNPQQTARWIGKSEAHIEAAMRQRNAPQSHQPTARRATQAPRPMTPLRGGGAAPPSQLGQVNNYIKKLYGDRG